jgi:hypothetical protein
MLSAEEQARMAGDRADGLGEGFQRGFALNDATSFSQLMLELYAYRCAVTGRQFEPGPSLPHPDLDIFLLQPLDQGGRLEFGNALVVENAVSSLLRAGRLLIADDYTIFAPLDGDGVHRPLHLHADRAFWPSIEAIAYHRGLHRR